MEKYVCRYVAVWLAKSDDVDDYFGHTFGTHVRYSITPECGGD